MGRLIINRESSYLAVLASYDIFLDNNVIGSVKNGEVLEFNVPDGYHTIHAKNALVPIGQSNKLTLHSTSSEDVTVFIHTGMLSLSGIKLRLVSTPVKSTEKYDEISKLHELKEKNIITEEEFIREKEKILKAR